MNQYQQNMSTEAFNFNVNNNPDTALKLSGNNTISKDDIFKIGDLYFKQNGIMYSHLLNSFDKLIEEDLPLFLQNPINSIITEMIDIQTNKKYTYRFEHKNFDIKPPYLLDEDRIMYPQDARIKNLTYAAKIVSDISQIQEITDINTGIKEINQIGETQREYTILNLPMLVKSKYCSLNTGRLTLIEAGEDEFDSGAYFIVSGNEKAVVSLEKMGHNRWLVFQAKEPSQISYNCQIRSKSNSTGIIQMHNIFIKKNNQIAVKLPIFNEIPLNIFMKALGIVTDLDIIRFCVQDENDTEMINLVTNAIKNGYSEVPNVTSQNDALLYLADNLKTIKNYDTLDSEEIIYKKIMDIKDKLNNKCFPHITGTLEDKAYFIGVGVHKACNCFLKRSDPDDRDSFVNKEIELVGESLMLLFVQYYKKIMSSCSKFFKKNSKNNVTPTNVINQIRTSIIDQGIRQALSTGVFNKNKGTSQMLQRLTYVQTQSTLRRINS